jgi:hypothetical protein
MLFKLHFYYFNCKACNINARTVACIVTLLQLVVLIAMLDNMNYEDVIMKVMTL